MIFNSKMSQTPAYEINPASGDSKVRKESAHASLESYPLYSKPPDAHDATYLWIDKTVEEKFSSYYS